MREGPKRKFNHGSRDITMIMKMTMMRMTSSICFSEEVSIIIEQGNIIEISKGDKAETEGSSKTNRLFFFNWGLCS
jgi:hypothetical protein